jgi:hypothetical protein
MNDTSARRGGRRPQEHARKDELARAASAEDSEGHDYRGWSNRDLKTDIQPLDTPAELAAAEEPEAAPGSRDDTEGHGYNGWSNRDLKTDIQPLDAGHEARIAAPDSATTASAQDDDTEGQGYVGWSNRDLKTDIQPLDAPAEGPRDAEAEGASQQDPAIEGNKRLNK